MVMHEKVLWSVFGFCLMMSSCALADVSVGEFADSLAGPVWNIADLINFLLRVTGVGLLITSVVRYIEYRKGVSDITIKSVLGFFFGGISLILITFALSPKV